MRCENDGQITGGPKEDTRAEEHTLELRLRCNIDGTGFFYTWGIGALHDVLGLVL